MISFEIHRRWQGNRLMPEMFDDGPNKVKIIHGLKQLDCIWDKTINDELLKMGLPKGKMNDD